MTQTLGLIGSGDIGSTVARLAIAAGMEVILSNSRGPETLADLVAELGDSARAGTPAEAARDGDLVVVATPLKAYTELPAEELAGKTVIETTNYYPHRDGHITELEEGKLTPSELVQRHLTDSRVVKAFNNIAYTHLGQLPRPSGATDRSALPIASNDTDAKAQVARFLDELGYDTVDAGTLADSWRTEPGTPVSADTYASLPMPSIRPEQTYEEQREAVRQFLEAPAKPAPAERIKKLVDAAERRGAASA